MMRFIARKMKAKATREWQTFASIAGLLIILLLLSWGLREWRIAEVRSSLPEMQEKTVAEALALIEDQFADIQAEMLNRAKKLAETSEIINGLRRYQSSGFTPEREGLISVFSQIDLRDREAVELYDRIPKLVAWKGVSVPLDEAPNAVRFLEIYQTAIVDDVGVRQALVVWYPVREGGKPIGAIRVVQIIGFKAPVHNRYLNDYSLAEVWSRQTSLPVEIHWGTIRPDSPAIEGHARVLQGIDGSILGHVFVKPPTPESLLVKAAQRADDVIAFWTTLLLLWIVVGLWQWFKTAKERTIPETNHMGRVFWRFLVFTTALWGLRFVLLAIEVPARWQTGKEPLSPLFDPTHLASMLGFGLMRSTGDLLITSLFALIFAIACLHFGSLFRNRTRLLYGSQRKQSELPATRFAPVAFILTILLTVLVLLGLVYLVSVFTHQAIIDSTHDYLARSGLFPDQPERLIVVVFCAQLLLMLSAVLIGTAVIWVSMWSLIRTRPKSWPTWTTGLTLLFALLLPLVVVYGLFAMQALVPYPVILLFIVAGVGIAVFSVLHDGRGLELLSLRGVLLSIFLISLLLYPIFYRGMDAKRRIQMVDAVESYDLGQDPRAIYAIEGVLTSAASSPEIRSLFVDEQNGDLRPSYADSLARDLLRGSLLTSLGSYDITLGLVNTAGKIIGRHYEGEQPAARLNLDESDSILYNDLRHMHADSPSEDVLVETLTGRTERDRVQYAGIIPVNQRSTQQPMGWIMVRAEPQTLFASNETPFPRVLLSTSFYGNLHTNLSITHFRNGVLASTFGRDFGRYRLAQNVREALLTQSELWEEETYEGSQYLTYYWKLRPPSLELGPGSIAPQTTTSVVAVRASALNMFDHLYYLLRLTVAGLFIGLPIYLIGFNIRRRAGMLPAKRVRFRDKVLNAFLAVGIISIAIVGFVGEEVVTGGTEGTVRNWLQQHLERVEEALILEAEGDELPYDVVNRTQVDSLAARVGLDLNIYRGYHLVQSSRPQLVRDRLIERRLPVEAYEALFFDGKRFVVTEERVGSFEYRAGFRALLDEEGHPGYVISVPTLPEQERIEEEQARTLAYLFGALLLLVLAVMLTASILANAIARPVGRLRAGLEAVAKGQFERNIPVHTRDEIGELVQTFNSMQDQLAESRRILAQQERQLAWREMARQVAHEIKNPLTPMKLSVQHLRRAYDTLKVSGNGVDQTKASRFTDIFDRITGTLIEQIDTLARIANEFHSFARMPSRVLERLDLNRVILEAVSLMQADTDVEITTELCRNTLIVEADHEELRRTYINLIKNAIEAIPEGVKGQIIIRSELRTHPETSIAYAFSTVKDNGSGISPELQSKIFEPNFSTKTSGTGLGLAISRKSIEDFRGEIGFDTTAGEGSTFWIRLPLAEETIEVS